jgi:hypothetical protein
MMASRKSPPINPETQAALTRSIDRTREDPAEEPQAELPHTDTDTPADDRFDIDDWG